MTQLPRIVNPQSASDFAQNLVYAFNLPNGDLPQITKYFVAFERTLLESINSGTRDLISQE